MWEQRTLPGHRCPSPRLWPRCYSGSPVLGTKGNNMTLINAPELQGCKQSPREGEAQACEVSLCVCVCVCMGVHVCMHTLRVCACVHARVHVCVCMCVCWEWELCVCRCAQLCVW